MKKFFCLLALTLTLLFTLSTVSFADETELDTLVATLHRGIIPLDRVENFEDLLSYMQIVDNSEDRILTSKLETFFAYISYYYYEPLTVDEIFERFKEKNTHIDINDMDSTYKALFSSLDRFSYYLTPDEAYDFFNPTSAKGIGIRMAWREKSGEEKEGIYVEEVSSGSPAEKAGITVGDRIVGFNSQNVDGLGFQALVALNTMLPDEQKTLSV
ncbi:MAG: PDZ domain-containing protein, partial [Clostridia bacterium]|nr:PDZ domain-containing protein [Clostridia bacterium]